jgi:DNA ligase-1
MINICNAEYMFKRTTSLLKVKKMSTVDLEIMGYEEGSGRLSGTLGAILVRYKGGNIVKVGSGFSDSLRDLIWENQADYLGAICEIQYFEETTNADGGTSLRFPIFKDFRPDKLTPDF